MCHKHIQYSMAFVIIFGRGGRGKGEFYELDLGVCSLYCRCVNLLVLFVCLFVCFCDSQDFACYKVGTSAR